MRESIAAISDEWAKKRPDEGVLDALIAQADTIVRAIEGT